MATPNRKPTAIRRGFVAASMDHIPWWVLSPAKSSGRGIQMPNLQGRESDWAMKFKANEECGDGVKYLCIYVIDGQLMVD